jgi:YgiT-type zinc finger domain-containing protein
MDMVKCPICEKGSLHKAKVKESMFGIALGEFDGERCDKCGETFLDSTSMKEIEKRAKAKGIWGISKKITIVKSGNSLAIRIPAKIARFLNLRDGEEAIIHPEGKERLVIEIVD